MSSPDVGDLSPEGPLPPLILLQQLLSAATQPSPIKAIFDRQEMEVSRVLFLSSPSCQRSACTRRGCCAQFDLSAFCEFLNRRLQLWPCVSTWLSNPPTRHRHCLRRAAPVRPPRLSPYNMSDLQSRRNRRPPQSLPYPSSSSLWRWASNERTSSLPSNRCLEPQAVLPVSQV